MEPRSTPSSRASSSRSQMFTTPHLHPLFSPQTRPPMTNTGTPAQRKYNHTDRFSTPSRLDHTNEHAIVHEFARLIRAGYQQRSAEVPVISSRRTSLVAGTSPESPALVLQLYYKATVDQLKVREKLLESEPSSALTDEINKLHQEALVWALMSELYLKRLDTKYDSDSSYHEYLIRRRDDPAMDVESNSTSQIPVPQSPLSVLNESLRSKDLSFWELHTLRRCLEQSSAHDAHVRVGGAVDATEGTLSTLASPSSTFSVLSYQIWTLIRAGLHSQAMTLARNSGQPWRAAILNGHAIAYDPVFDAANFSGISSGTGNAHRRLYQRVARQSSQSELLDKYERALYAYQSASLEPMLEVCGTWHDALWAHCSVILDSRLTLKIDTFASALPKEKLQDADHQVLQSNASLTLAEVFSKLRSSSIMQIQEGSNSECAQLLTWIMLNDIPTLVETLGNWVRTSSYSTPLSPHLLRLAVHLLVFFDAAGLYDYRSHASEAPTEHRQSAYLIIRAYFQFLCAEVVPLHPDLQTIAPVLAMYASLLPRHRTQSINGETKWRDEAVCLFSSYVLGAALTREDREYCLRICPRYDLDPDAVAIEVVALASATLLSSLPSPQAPTLFAHGQPVSPEHQMIIQSLEWLCIRSEQRIDALLQCNALLRAFLLLGAFSSAQDLVKAFQYHIPKIDDDLERLWSETQKYAGEVDASREHHSILRYLEAIELVHRWEAQLVLELPHPSAMDGTITAIGAVGEEEERRQYQNIYRERKRLWEVELNHCVDFVSAGFNAVFTFPGGFLIDIETNTDVTPRPTTLEQIPRLQRQQLLALRKICIPSAFNYCLRALLSVSRIQNCLELAVLLADERLHLIDSFQPHELKTFLQSLVAPAAELAEQANITNSILLPLPESFQQTLTGTQTRIQSTPSVFLGRGSAKSTPQSRKPSIPPFRPPHSLKRPLAVRPIVGADSQ